MLIPILIILLNAKFILCENHFMATVRNLTNSTNNSNENSKRAFNNDNILIDEVKKYLNECKTDATGESRHDEGNNRNTGSYLGSHGVKSNFHNAERRSNRESGSFDDGNIDGFLTNYRNDRTNYRPKNPCADERRSYNQRSEGNNNYENYHPRSRNTNEFGRRGGENYESNRNRAYEPNLNYRNRQDYNNHEPSYRRSQNNDDFNNYDRGIEYPDGGQSRDVVRWRRQSENVRIQKKNY